MSIVDTAQRQRYIARQDIYYDRPVRNSWDGLPIGNGVCGTAVWTRGTAVCMQLNRVDLFATNSSTTAPEFDMASPGYYGTHEYRGGLGTLMIDLGLETAPAGRCLQRLSLYHGTVYLESAAFAAEIFVAADGDLLCARVRRKCASDRPLAVVLEALREEHIIRRRHRARTWFAAGDPTPALMQRFAEEARYGFADNDHFAESALILALCGPDGRRLAVDVTTGAVAGAERLCTRDLDYRGVVAALLAHRATLQQRVLTVAPEVEEFTLYAASAVSTTPDSSAATAAQAGLDRGLDRGFEGLRQSHRAWWSRFWERSYVRVKDYPLLDRYFVTNLYYMGSCMRGEYPAQYNGLLWNTQGDLAFWGGQFWWFNTGRNFYCLDKMGHGELAHPLFRMLRRNVPRYVQAARQQWRCEGIYFPETDAFNGPERLPAVLADQLHELLVHGTVPGDGFLEHIRNRSGMCSRWALFYDRDHQQRGIINSFGWHSNLVYNAGDVAHIMWEHYLHTRDRAFLEQTAYPWMEGVARFYATFPGLVREDDGRYHMHHTGWSESIAAARDVIDDLAVIRGLFPAVRTAARILGRPLPLADRLGDILEHLAPYPDSLMPDTLALVRHPAGHRTYAVAREPARGHGSNGCSNDCRLRMTYLFDLVNLERREACAEEWETTMHSLEALPTIKQILSDAHPTHRDWGYVWNRTVLKAARMGRADLVEKGLPLLLRQFTMPSHYGQHKRVWRWPNRMPWTNEAQSASIQEMGAMSDCLQEPLMQSLAAEPGGQDATIHLFPAWPQRWDAEFQLHSRDDFDVYARQQDGEVADVVIDSRAGRECRVRNPWAGQEVTLKDMATAAARPLTGDMLVFPTRAGAAYRLSTRKDSGPTHLLDAVQPAILFDQVAIHLPYYDGLPTLAPGEETAAVLSSPVDDAAFSSVDPTVAEVSSHTWHGHPAAMVRGVGPGETRILATAHGRIAAQALIRVSHRMVDDYDPDIAYHGDWKGWWYALAEDAMAREQRLYGRSGRENHPGDDRIEAGNYFLDPDSMNRPRPWYDSYHYTAQSGAYFEYAFTGRGVEIIGVGCPAGGVAEVYVDDSSVGTFSSHTPAQQYQHSLYTRDGLGRGAHRLRVVASSGTLYLDALKTW